MDLIDLKNIDKEKILIKIEDISKKILKNARLKNIDRERELLKLEGIMEFLSCIDVLDKETYEILDSRIYSVIDYIDKNREKLLWCFIDKESPTKKYLVDISRVELENIPEQYIYNAFYKIAITKEELEIIKAIFRVLSYNWENKDEEERYKNIMKLFTKDFSNSLKKCENAVIKLEEKFQQQNEFKYRYKKKCGENSFYYSNCIEYPTQEKIEKENIVEIYKLAYKNESLWAKKGVARIYASIYLDDKNTTDRITLEVTENSL